MSDAPKRIWTTCNTPLASSKSGTWHEHPYGEPYILAAERDAIAALTVERCAEVAKVGWVSADYDLVGIADADMAMKLCEHIAAAIRALKDRNETEPEREPDNRTDNPDNRLDGEREET